MREIYYEPKITNAKTQYVSISDIDKNWLLSEFIKYLALTGELKNIRDNRDVNSVVYDYWRKKSKTLPKSRYGQNSPETFISGMINNLMFGTQNDLSDIQMDAITNISCCMHLIYETLKPLNLQPNVKEYTPIQFRQKLFSI